MRFLEDVNNDDEFGNEALEQQQQQQPLFTLFR